MPPSVINNELADASHATAHGHESAAGKAAAVRAAGSLTVKRNVSAGSELHVGGDLHVGGCVDDSRIICAGEVEVPNGSIRGGKVSAYRGVKCQSLGDQDGTETEIWIGFDNALLEEINAKLPEVRKTFDKANDFRIQLEPMLKDSQGLSPQQKEQISDLLFRAGDAKRRGQVVVKNLLNRLKEAEANAGMQCVVTGTAFQKVSLYFPGAKVTLETSVAGPVNFIVSRGHLGVSVTAFHPDSGKSQPMQWASFVDPVQEARSSLETLEKS